MSVRTYIGQNTGRIEVESNLSLASEDNRLFFQRKLELVYDRLWYIFILSEFVRTHKDDAR